MLKTAVTPAIAWMPTTEGAITTAETSGTEGNQQDPSNKRNTHSKNAKYSRVASQIRETSNCKDFMYGSTSKTADPDPVPNPGF